MTVPCFSVKYASRAVPGYKLARMIPVDEWLWGGSTRWPSSCAIAYPRTLTKLVAAPGTAGPG